MGYSSPRLRRSMVARYSRNDLWILIEISPTPSPPAPSYFWIVHNCALSTRGSDCGIKPNEQNAFRIPNLNGDDIDMLYAILKYRCNVSGRWANNYNYKWERWHSDKQQRAFKEAQMLFLLIQRNISSFKKLANIFEQDYSAWPLDN